jgi:UDP-N-acetylglucosamine:LPS N-acetylglucosamine transferase
LNQLKTFQGKVFFLRGLPDNNTLPALKLPGIDIKNHLPASELNLIVQQSATLICRSGYTSVMDLVKLQKKAILVPTPGQTEQEYLAKYLFDNRLFYTVSQHHFSLTDDLNKANFFLQETINIPFDNYQTVVEKFAVKIKKTTGAGI